MTHSLKLRNSEFNHSISVQICLKKLKINSFYPNEIKWERCGKIITFVQHCTKIEWLDWLL